MMFGSTKITVSPYALHRWKETRLKPRYITWRGIKECVWDMVQVDCQKPAAYRIGNDLVMHPAIYQQMKNDPRIQDVSGRI